MTTSEEATQPAGKGRIKPLAEKVVNQIAAGEVVQRPASALKELLENAIDAGATHITVTVAEGGLKLLQIKDNGRGIHPDDMPILCHRHTTSKIAEFSDLAAISTLGFRGEALCSISFVSRLTVTSMQPGAELGYRAEFRDSEMLAPAPEPCASVQGTCIQVEDLFYNVPNRKRAMRSANEEFKRIFDVVAKYAVFCTGVGVTLTRAKQVKPDLLTQARFTRLDAVRAVYGAAVSKNVAPFAAASDTWDPSGHAAPPPPPPAPEEPTFSAEGLVSTGNAAVKKTSLVLFINGRPAECAPLKAALDSTYATLHSKAACYWAFVDVKVPPAHVDVNIHPTKSEVALLFQPEIIEAVRGAVDAVLAGCHGVRTFARADRAGAQAIPDPLKPVNAARQTQLPGADGATDATTQRARAGGDHKLVRTDHRARSLTPFLAAAATSDAPAPAPAAAAAALAGSVRRKGALGKRNANRVALDDAAAAATPSGLPPGGADPNPPVADAPAELRAALDAIETHAHFALSRLVREYIFVGHLEGTRVLLQQGSRLYLVDAAPLSRDLFAQQALRRCGRFAPVRLQPPLDLAEAVGMGLEAQAAEGRLTAADGSPEELQAMILELLSLKAPYLRDTWGVRIEGGSLHALPQLIAGYCPDMDAVPDFLVRLAVEVEWSEGEAALLRDIPRVLAELYAVTESRFASVPPDTAVANTVATAPTDQAEPADAELEHDARESDAMDVDRPSGEGCAGAKAAAGPGAQGGERAGGDPRSAQANACASKHSENAIPLGGEAVDAESKLRKWIIEHVILPAARQHLRVPYDRASDGTVVQIAALEQLYRVFERC